MAEFTNEPRVVRDAIASMTPPTPKSAPAAERHACVQCDYTGPTQKALYQHKHKHHKPETAAPVTGEVIEIGTVEVIEVTVSNGRTSRLVRVNGLSMAVAVDAVAGALRQALSPLRR